MWLHVAHATGVNIACIAESSVVGHRLLPWASHPSIHPSIHPTASVELQYKVKGKSLSRVRLLETPWTAAYQAPPSMGFSRQEYWSGVPSPSLECSNKPP